MVYNVHLTHRAEKQLDDLPSTGRSDVLAALVQLAETPRPQGCSRVLYDIDDDPCEVTVFRIQDRKDVYKRR